MDPTAFLTGIVGTVMQSVINATKPSGSPAAMPVAPVMPVASVSSASPLAVGLQLLLEPRSSGVIFRAACNTAAVVYPVYKSFKAIESKDAKDDTQWLTYWTIYGTLTLLEASSDNLLDWFPYYYHAKFAFLLWLQLPKTQGATVLYTRYMRPTLTKYQPKVDAVLDRVTAFVVGLYHVNKVPIDAAVALLLTLKSQVTKFLSTSGADGGAAPDAAKAQFIKGA